MPVMDMGFGGPMPGMEMGMGGPMPRMEMPGFNPDPVGGPGPVGGGANPVSGSINVVGTAGSDAITASALDDVITGNGGNDFIQTGTGNDVIVFSSADASADITQVAMISDFTDGSDRIGLGSGISSVAQMSAMSDPTNSANSAILLNGQFLALLQNVNAASINSSDFVFANPQTVGGTAGNDTLVGGLGDDTIAGLGGDDVISGDKGADSITGGGGADTLSGGDGADRFIYTASTDSASGSGDTITDFGGTDHLVFSGLLQGTFAFNGAGSFAGGGNTSALFNDGTDLLSVDVNGDGSSQMEITLSGVSLGDLDLGSFIVTA